MSDWRIVIAEKIVRRLITDGGPTRWLTAEEMREQVYGVLRAYVVPGDGPETKHAQFLRDYVMARAATRPDSIDGQAAARSAQAAWGAMQEVIEA